MEDVYLEGRDIIWILEINIKKFNTNIMLLNIVIIKGLNYWYLFFWGECGTLFIVHESWDDKTTECNF